MPTPDFERASFGTPGSVSVIVSIQRPATEAIPRVSVTPAVYVYIHRIKQD